MTKTITIIGGGPSGLMAAEVLSAHGYAVTVYERKPTFARKFLMAGRGGLNITHSEKMEDFIKKYTDKTDILKPLIENFTPKNMRDWCHALGEDTFIGSSGRVFPKSFKASPLLRAWLKCLENQRVKFNLNHDWQGWKNNALLFNTPSGNIEINADATLLALGGASWPKLGADGSWVKILEQQKISITPLRPANCGFCVNWSPYFAQHYQGNALKSIDLCFQDKKIRGEFIITEHGVEGGAIYALCALLRNKIEHNNSATLTLDLKADLSAEEILARLNKPRQKKSLSTFLRKNLNLPDAAIGLLMEKLDRTKLSTYTPQQLLTLIKSYPLTLTAPFSIERAISTAGGVSFDSLDKNFMFLNKPGVFVTGEMLDWEAPTGGYLLQGCFASGVHVAKGIHQWLTTPQ